LHAHYVQEMPEAAEGEKPAQPVEVGAAAAASAAAAEATDQWVQCDRCRTWRIVPDQHWPSVEADPREVRPRLLCFGNL
jgi:hypothetical protein